MQRVVLASPLHDPDGRITEVLKMYGSTLSRLYDGKIAVSVTELSSKGTIEALRNANIQYVIQSKDNATRIGDNYRQALRLGLTFPVTHVHLMDFDRALHWVRRFPKELETVIEKIQTFEGFLSFVRTRRAFESHPLTQRTTETTINAIASEVAGIGVDIMSGSYGLDKNLATNIVYQSKRNDFGIYAELLEIALREKVKINTIEVDGLEWETPDQYQDKIEKEGYAAWIDEFESLTEWEKRVRLIEDSTKVLTE